MCCVVIVWFDLIDESEGNDVGDVVVVVVEYFLVIGFVEVVD